MRNRLQIGLDKLISTASQVAKLQVELRDMQPKLVETQKEVEEMLVVIDKDKASAAETKTVVEKEESAAQEMAAETKAIAEDAQRDLDEALPALDAAVACLNKLKKSDIDEVRSMKKPPGGVVLTAAVGAGGLALGLVTLGKGGSGDAAGFGVADLRLLDRLRAYMNGSVSGEPRGGAGDAAGSHVVLAPTPPTALGAGGSLGILAQCSTGGFHHCVDGAALGERRELWN